MNAVILQEENILLRVATELKLAAIRRAGELLLKNGYIGKEYIEGMEKRESSLTTYVGNGIAIPHGLPDYVRFIYKSGIVVLQYPGGVDFGEGNTAYILIGIAGKEDEHLELLSSIALVCQEETNVRRLMQAGTKQEIISILSGM